MRFLIWLVLLVLHPALQAQEARLKLEDGSTLQGELIEVGDQHIRLAVEGRIVTVEISKILDFTEVESGSRTEADEPPPGGSGVPGTARPQQGRPSVIADPGNTAPRSRFGSRLGWITQRYSWIPSDDVRTAASGAMVFLLLLAAAFHFASRVTSMDGASFQRSLTLSLVVVIAAAAQIAFVPATPTAGICAAVGSLLGWFLMTKLVFEARFPDMFWLGVALVGCAVLSLLLMELVDGVLSMLQDGLDRSWDS